MVCTRLTPTTNIPTNHNTERGGMIALTALLTTPHTQNTERGGDRPERPGGREARDVHPRGHQPRRHGVHRLPAADAPRVGRSVLSVGWVGGGSWGMPQLGW